ncbi:UDP-N-acetylglucosamine 1-carboxyvinyltransferase [Candidatus Gottesmanbacteria bacterium]|nr:UDP-N-acetylglucosamine 1-carboxyvinyltransferase [Candidatus Gottesmanbacteria bacterium]
MENLSIKGGIPLEGVVSVSGAKNVAMKVILAGLLTEEKLTIHGVPDISSVTGTADIVRPLGVNVEFTNHTLCIDPLHISGIEVPLDIGSHYRSATMVLGPLLQRFGKAKVPNPGGCRLGQRPIDRHIEAIEKMGAKITYNSNDGYFYAKADKLHGTHHKFNKNTHTGTEAMILAAVLAEGETIIENAASEPEVYDLVALLNLMGANIQRVAERKIIIKGVKKLHGAEFTIMPDRNEVVTYAIAALATQGDIIIRGAQRDNLKSFLQKVDESDGGWEPIDSNSTRFYSKGPLKKTDVITKPHPGFMTDWQAPWALLMTQAHGTSTIHETIFEDRFSYVTELKRMGAKISFENIIVDNPEDLYNFNYNKYEAKPQVIKIKGPTPLHEAILKMSDIRAGATLILAALCAKGESYIHGLDHIDRGYEKIDERLQKLGANIKRLKE